MARKARQSRTFSDTHPEFELDPNKMPEPPVSDEGDDNKPEPVSREEFDRVRADLAKANEQNAELLRSALQGQRAPVAKPVEPALPDLKINLDGLPDPAEDKDGFLKGFAQRLGPLVTAAQANAAKLAVASAGAAINADNLIDKAWDMLKDKYPELSKHEDIVETAVRGYTASLQAKNIDPSSYLATNMEQFVKDIATSGQKIIDRIKGLEGEDEESAQEDEGRALEIPGGGTQGTRRNVGKTTHDRPAKFTDELKSVQKELGIF